MMQQFIHDIFGDSLGQQRRLSIFAVPSLRSELFDDVGRAIAYAKDLATQQNVYFSLGLIAGQPAGRGKAEEVAAIGALWADIDLASDAHPGKRLPATVEEAESILVRMPLAPSMVVHSGHGLHAYWLLDRPWVFQDAQDRARAATLARGWHGAVCSAAEALGWKLENLGDLARVLRLPGTWNHNGGGQPVEVRILRRDASVRYFIGPVNVVRKATLGEISFVDLGADGNTSANVAASAKENINMDGNDTIKQDKTAEGIEGKEAPAAAAQATAGTEAGTPAIKAAATTVTAGAGITADPVADMRASGSSF